MADRYELSDDERYIVVDGRRWRATDPSIPAPFRAELVSELMAARRAIGHHRDDDQIVERARRCVDDAKRALGERGRPWWETPEPTDRRQRIASTLRTLLRHRPAPKTICPSDVARIVAQPAWREAMDDVRAVARELADDGVLEVVRRGQRVESDEGTIRYRAGPNLELVP